MATIRQSALFLHYTCLLSRNNKRRLLKVELSEELTKAEIKHLQGANKKIKV